MVPAPPGLVIGRGAVCQAGSAQPLRRSDSTSPTTINANSTWLTTSQPAAPVRSIGTYKSTSERTT